MLLIGYGTLLNVASLGRSIGPVIARSKSYVPVVIVDHVRLFNLRPDHYEPSFRFESQPIEVAAMNVEPRLGSFFNAVAFSVNDQELEVLDRRERYYRRQEVPVYGFPDRVYLGQGAVYTSDPHARWIDRDPTRLLPHWQDVLVARAGSFAISPAFGRTFDETTYLADGRTLVFDRYREHLSSTGDRDDVLSGEASEVPPRKPKDIGSLVDNEWGGVP